MYWFYKCFVGLAVLAVARSISPGSGTQQCVPPGPGLTLNDFLSGKFYLFERQQAFSIKLLQTAVAASPKQNLIFSPHSIYTALLITYFLSRNHTEEKLKSFLNLPPEQVWRFLLKISRDPVKISSRYNNFHILQNLVFTKCIVLLKLIVNYF